MAKGIVRKIDELGRVTLPMEYRKSFGINNKDSIGIYLTDGIIRLVKGGKGFRGIARELDELGRLTLPIEIRRILGFEDRQEVDMYADGEEICIKKHGKYCAICGRTGELFELYPVKEAHVCKSCALAVTDMVMEQSL